MGASDAFDITKANFAGISDTEKIYIDKVVHKAIVEFGEEGAEAAAATIVTNTNRSDLLMESFVFKCNKPFMFVIHENKNKTIIFIGKYLK